MTPSLLPRGPLFQGLVSGLSGATGYGIGVFAVWLVRYMRSKDSSPPAPRRAWLILIAAGAVGMVAMVIWFHVWQDRVRDLMGVAHLKWFDYPLATALSLIVLFAVVEIGQLIRRLFRFLDLRLDRFAPPRVSAVIVVFLLVALTIALLNGVVVKFAMRTMNNTFEAVNNEMNPDTAAPKTPLRSGGPQSLVSWESLGHQGRIFVKGGPTVAQLTAFNGAPATEPIRAYAGLESADSITATAELAARELQRTGGLRRAVIAVGTTTGTGWINEAEADALEYMYNGNTAIVSMQYSFLPSWLSFLVDKTERPPRRPGAVRGGGQAGARTAGGSASQACGVRRKPGLIRRRSAVHEPRTTSWPAPTAHCFPGRHSRTPSGPTSPRPAIAAHRNGCRSTTTDTTRGSWPVPDDLGRPHAAWRHPRVVYLQHASDPIAWWNPDLLFRKPDWLREKRGYDVLPETEWIPVVTFLQVSADMAVAVDVPQGHGHVYVADVANGWAAVLQPPGWTPAKTDKLRPLLHASDS